MTRTNTTSRKQLRNKGRAMTGTWVALPHAVMDSAGFRALSGSAVKLLCDIARQFRGNNNGDLCAAWKVMQARGWRSRDTLHHALRELQEKGLIEKTRQGGLNRCSLFALTWLSIDECAGKLDVSPTNVASGLWRQWSAVTEKSASPESVSARHEIRVNRLKAA